MHVLGISCHYHDAAAALLRDGVLVAAAQEERFSRRKHDAAFPLRAIEFCLQQAGIEAGDLDYVVFYEKPFAKAELGTYLAVFLALAAHFRRTAEDIARDLVAQILGDDVAGARNVITQDQIGRAHV